MTASQHASAWLLSGLFISFLAGCGGGATVSESQCLARDWQTLGYLDGVNGLRSSTLLNHHDGCVEYATPDREGYLIGWHEGIAEFCQADNAFRVGENGWTYYNVCPIDQEAAFLVEFNKGHNLYLVRRDIADLERRIDHGQSRLAELKAQLIGSAAGQFSGTLTPQERATLIAQSQRLNNERIELERELPALERELSMQNARLNTLRQTLATAT